jgi:UDP:flavonoid glycosyltransferase YjiC (YdhE family)
MTHAGAQPTVALAVSGHGFGHAVRCAEVARALLGRGARVKLRTDAPAWLFPEEAEILRSPGWPLDVGVAQRDGDGLDLDIDETRRRWTAFASEFDARLEVEARLLVEHGVDVLLGDVPPLGLAAAARAGIPSVALGNFGWDWIYAIWPEFEAIVARIQAAYAQTDLLLRLPLHSPLADAFPAFRAIEDVPLIARRAPRDRRTMRSTLNLRHEATLVLLSFGGFNTQGLDIHALGEWTRYVFVLTPPLSIMTPANDLPPNVVALADNPPDFVSLVSACDAVVTKPGYGIAADCLANRVAMLFTDRGPFRESDVLAQALPALGRARYVPREDLLAGHLGPHLDALLESNALWTTQPMNGADTVAERVAALARERKVGTL